MSGTNVTKTPQLSSTKLKVKSQPPGTLFRPICIKFSPLKLPSQCGHVRGQQEEKEREREVRRLVSLLYNDYRSPVIQKADQYLISKPKAPEPL